MNCQDQCRFFFFGRDLWTTWTCVLICSMAQQSNIVIYISSTLPFYFSWSGTMTEEVSAAVINLDTSFSCLLLQGGTATNSITALALEPSTHPPTHTHTHVCTNDKEKDEKNRQTASRHARSGFKLFVSQIN